LNPDGSEIGSGGSGGGNVNITQVGGNNVTTTLPVADASAESSLTTIATNTTPLAQGSTTSGQSGELTMGAVTTSAPTYTTGQTDPLSLTTTGLLRVGGSATGSAVPSTAFPIGIQGATSNLTSVIAIGQLSDATGANSAIAVGNIAFNGTSFDRIRTIGGVTAGTSTGITASGIVSGLMPVGTVLNTYESLISTSATTTVTAATAYISNIVLSINTGGTTSTITIQDGQGTPQVLINGLSTATASLTPTTYSLHTPIKLTSGIKIVTAGAAPATIAVWINYYQ